MVAALPLVTASVPAAVPSLDHNWYPLVGSKPAKNTALPAAVISVGEVPPPAALPLVSRTVPAAVPLVIQSWVAVGRVVAGSRAAAGGRQVGGTAPGYRRPPLMSATMVVPAAVPSLLKSW